MRWLGEAVAGWPRTVRPVTLERARFPRAERPSGAADALAVAAATVISPPNSETDWASPEAFEEARAPEPLCAEAASAPAVAAEPSAGSAKPLPNETW